MADFTGFSYNGVHSSELNLTVVSNGSRLTKNLLPSFKDTISTVEGRHGNYYYGAKYDKSAFTISTAFDNLHEEQLRQIQRLFHKQDLCQLIFDELPYKVYDAKLAQEPKLNFVCFDGPVRIYKGELDLPFVCYTPFAHSQYKYLNEYRTSDHHYVNVDEWAWASGMKEIQGTYDIYANQTIPVFNPGDLDTDYVLRFSRTADIQAVTIDLNGSSYTLTFPTDGSDLVYGAETYTGIVTIDTNKHFITQTLIDANDDIIATNVINHYLTAGRLILLAGDEGLLTFTISLGDGATVTDIFDVSIQYDYLYL